MLFYINSVHLSPPFHPRFLAPAYMNVILKICFTLELPVYHETTAAVAA